jgi:hypothetical protein
VVWYCAFCVASARFETKAAHFVCCVQTTTQLKALSEGYIEIVKMSGFLWGWFYNCFLEVGCGRFF